MRLTADTITDEQIIEATAFDPRVPESRRELILLRERALLGLGRGDDVTEDMRHTARARCAEILNGRVKAMTREEALETCRELVNAFHELGINVHPIIGLNPVGTDRSHVLKLTIAIVSDVDARLLARALTLASTIEQQERERERRKADLADHNNDEVKP